MSPDTATPTPIKREGGEFIPRVIIAFSITLVSAILSLLFIYPFYLSRLEKNTQMTATVTRDPIEPLEMFPNSIQNRVGIETNPNIPNGVMPVPDGNNALPPRTNLSGPPSAFRDDISGSGGIPPMATTDDPEQAQAPPSRLDMVYQWFDRNKSVILTVGLGIFAFVAITRTV